MIANLLILILSILILAMIVLFALRRLQRSFFYPSPTNLPDTVEDNIHATLQRFESALAKHAPRVLSSLQPGLSDEQIAAVESKYGLRLTAEMRVLYRWRNGVPRFHWAELIPGHRFVPLQEAARTRHLHLHRLSSLTLLQRLTYAIFAGHRTGWLAVLEDGAVDGYFYDPARRRLLGNFFVIFAEDGHYRFFPSLTNFLKGAAECYETGIYRSSRRGQLIEDFKKSFDLWPRYAASSGMPNEAE